MPGAATVHTAGGTRQDTRGRDRGGDAPVATVPFVRASQMHRESAGVDVSRTMTAALQDLGTFSIPAYGFLRAIVILVTTTLGAGTSVTATEDAPFNALQSITLSEPNGAVINQYNSGFDLFLCNKYGGYRYMNDPKASPVYSVTVGTSALFQFLLRIPVEINTRDALGSLPNQNSAAQFLLRMFLAPIATVFGGTVSTPPLVRIRAWAEEWDQPEAVVEGAQNQTTPPAMNTTQYWSVQSYNVNAGQQSPRLTRMGNYIRNLIFIFRATSDGTRLTGDAQWPDPVTVYWDTRPLDTVPKLGWQQQIAERYGYGVKVGATTPANESAQGLDNGVYPYDFAHEFTGRVGFENRDLWLPTIGSTRFEIGGSFGAAGTLYVLTNDVSVAGNVFL